MPRGWAMAAAPKPAAPRKLRSRPPGPHWRRDSLGRHELWLLRSGDLPQLLCFEALDVFESVADEAADLDETRPVAGPAPALEGPRRDPPARGQLDLGEMRGRHRQPLRID